MNIEPTIRKLELKFRAETIFNPFNPLSDNKNTNNESDKHSTDEDEKYVNGISEFFKTKFIYGTNLSPTARNHTEHTEHHFHAASVMSEASEFTFVLLLKPPFVCIVR
uniref:Uncharacterized protein n=1 Tax=Glossina pallidipes TaxID=7398 RepID=A0A1A9ZJ91_GLOPL